MLIVPAEHRFDARHLPFATVLVALICTLVFALYQSGDRARVEYALEVYAQQELLNYEQPLLQAYRGDTSETGSAGVDGTVLEIGFDAYVHDYWKSVEPAPAWAAARAQFEAARDRISWYRFGLVPAEMKPAAVLGHMFLHGSWGHLLGNLLFLLLFGMLLERLLGSALFFGTYLLTGVLAAGVFALANTGSHVPLVGASGAISGLMGAYLGVYRLRKVTFFYTLGFWFGKFTAPALLVFPLWLGKELYGYFSVGGPVAYAAHAGGLLGGLAIAVLLHRQASVTLDSDAKTRRTDTERRETLARIRGALTDLKIDEALRLAAQALRQSPNEFAYWQVYVEAADRLAAGPAHERAMRFVFANAGMKAMPVDFLREVLKQYRARNGEGGHALEGKAGAALARRFFREGCVRDADQLLDALFRSGGLSPAFTELLETLLGFAKKNDDRRRAQRYEKYLAATPGPATDQAVVDPS